jgi:uncharacterized protein YkwD
MSNQKKTLLIVAPVLFLLLGTELYFSLESRPVPITPEIAHIATSTPDIANTPTSTPKTPTKAPLTPRTAPGEIVGTAITSQNIFNGINQIRYKAGIPILKENAKLDVAAEAKLQDELSKGYFAHVSPDGHNHQYWIEQAGYVPTYSGENLAIDFSTVQDTIAAFVASPTHYANIVKPQYTETGIAVSGSYVVQIFATPYDGN